MIRGVLISDTIFETKFNCDLSVCKGACCLEGDYGAPLNYEEIIKIKEILPMVFEILPEENKEVIRQKGISTYFKEPDVNGTTLMEDAACVFLIKDKSGIGKCSFELLFENGLTDFKKPISCELYPIRMLENDDLGFTAMNYDEWDICKGGCTLGEKINMPLFRFLKKAIIRKFDEPFYEELEAYHDHLQKK